MNRFDDAMSDDPVLVVGSGPCGAIAAARLIERGLRVTLLDAGVSAPRGMVVRAGGNTLFRRQDKRRLESNRHQRSADQDVEWISSRTLGGLSNYWTAAVPRFAPDDFTEGAALDERYVWPLTYDELVPFYEMAEAALVVTAGAPFANIPANVARFHNSPPRDWADFADRAVSNGYHLGSLPMAKGTPWMVARRGTEFSSYHCIIAPLLASRRFNLIVGANVTRLNWNGGSSRVESVDYVDRRTGRRATVRGRAVIVAAGAIDSTVLLLRSTSSDFPQGLGNSAGLIGRYLHDHPREWWPAFPSRRMTALAHPLYLSRAPYDPANPLLATSLTFGLSSHRVHTYLRNKTPSFGVQVFGTMIPRPDIGVALSNPVAPDTVDCRPRITLAYDQATVDNMLSARERLKSLFSDAGTRVTIPGPFYPLVPGSSIHYGGTVRMHHSPQYGALDRWNRLHDVQNVVVCDSSCFTTGPEKNPALTAMAIAARAADHLAEHLS